MSEIEDKIARFVGHFRAQCSRIADLGTERHHNLFKKTLYVAVIDALARSIYPRRGNRDRFVAFMKEFGAWNEAERVSLPHLVGLMTKAPDPVFSRLREFALTELAKWAEGEYVPLSRDPSCDTIRRLWPPERENRLPVGEISLESLQHVHLLYVFRNSLVHELRELGYGIEIEKDTVPFYMSCTSYGLDDSSTAPGRKSWELIYPVAFFEQLCNGALQRLEIYLRNSQLDPYAFHRFGSYWIVEIN